MVRQSSRRAAADAAWTLNDVLLQWKLSLFGFEKQGAAFGGEATWQAVLAEEPGNRRACERLARLVEQGSAAAASKDIQEESGEN
jgi:hypothetical protein